MSLVELITLALSIFSALMGGGWLIGRVRKEKERGDATQALAKGGISLLEWAQKLESRLAIVEQEMADVKRDYSELLASVNEEPHDIRDRIITRAGARRVAKRGNT